MSVYEKALALLERPELYPGLERWPDHELIIRVWVYEALTYHSSWLLRKSADVFWIRRIQWEPGTTPGTDEPQTYGSEAIVPTEKATSILEPLDSFVVSPFLKPAHVGIDGTTFGVETRCYYLNAHLSWWSTPPESWHPVANWLEESVTYFDSLLPESTAAFPHAGRMERWKRFVASQAKKRQ